MINLLYLICKILIKLEVIGYLFQEQITTFLYLIHLELDISQLLLIDIMDSNNSCLHEKTVSMLETLPFEQVYLQMMKWILAVNKKTANAAIYGDTGRYPLSIVCSKELIDYFQRVTVTKDNSDILAIVKDAVIEQKTLGLDWFTRTESVI